MVRSDGNGSFIIKKAYGIIIFILLIVTTTISAVMAVGLTPLKEDVIALKANDKKQDDEINQLKTCIAVRDEQYKHILEKLDEIKKELHDK